MLESAARGFVRADGRRHDGPKTQGSRRAGRTEPPSAAPVRRGMKEKRSESGSRIRVLVVFEDGYRAYRETIADALRTLRPGAEVTVAEPDAIESEMARINPHLVICGQPEAVDSPRVFAWVELPQNPSRHASIRLDGQRTEASNPTLEELLTVVDAAEDLIRVRPHPDDR